MYMIKTCFNTLLQHNTLRSYVFNIIKIQVI